MAPPQGSEGEQQEDLTNANRRKTRQLSKGQLDRDRSSSDSEEEPPRASLEDAKRRGFIMGMVNKNIPLFYGNQGPHLAAEVTTFLTAVDHVDQLLGSSEERKLFLSFVKVRFREDAATQIKSGTFKSLKKLRAHMVENYMPISTCTDSRAKLMNAKQKRSETILKFAGRVKTLLDDYKLNLEGEYDQDNICGLLKEAEGAAVLTFKKGLRSSKIRSCLLGEASKKLTDIIKKVVKLEADKTELAVSESESEDEKHQSREKNETKYCEICQTLGHSTKNCEKVVLARLTTQSGEQNKYCEVCQNEEHSTKSCPRLTGKTIEKTATRDTTYCEFCQNSGHSTGNCKEMTKARGSMVRSAVTNSFCEYCQQGGHSTAECGKMARARTNTGARQTFAANRNYTYGNNQGWAGQYQQGNAYQQNGVNGPRLGLTCYKCGGEGHMIRNCPTQERVATVPTNTVTGSEYCLHCQTSGHNSSQCVMWAKFRETLRLSNSGNESGQMESTGTSAQTSDQ